jgi:hypothetical protein
LIEITVVINAMRGIAWGIFGELMGKNCVFTHPIVSTTTPNLLI